MRRRVFDVGDCIFVTGDSTPWYIPASMHPASLEKMRHFRSVYVDDGYDQPVRVLDVGSLTVSEAGSENLLNYRKCFEGARFAYTGLDLAPGRNVDVVPADPYRWDEIDDESFEIVISGQALEHNPYFWITLAEMARVLVPGGLVCIIAPSRGFVHRFPLDCWRFFPDAGPALCAYVDLELLESYVEVRRLRKVTHGQLWHDFLLIAKKPKLDSDPVRKRFYDQLRRIVDTRCPFPTQTGDRLGPAILEYERAQQASLYEVMRAYLRAARERVRFPYAAGRGAE